MVKQSTLVFWLGLRWRNEPAVKADKKVSKSANVVSSEKLDLTFPFPLGLAEPCSFSRPVLCPLTEILLFPPREGPFTDKLLGPVGGGAPNLAFTAGDEDEDDDGNDDDGPPLIVTPEGCRGFG